MLIAVSWWVFLRRWKSCRTSPEKGDHYLKTELDRLVSTDSKVWEFVQSAILDGIWYWDLEHPENEWLSPQFCRTFGYEPGEIPHSPDWWQSNIHPEDLEGSLENFHTHRADPSVPYDQVVRYAHKDGSTVWVRCRGMIVRSKNGTPTRMLGAHTDVTELMKTLNKLRSSNRSLEQFAFTASHDLREPVRTMRSYAEALFEELEEQGVEFTEEMVFCRDTIEEAAERSHSLIDDLLRFAKAGLDLNIERFLSGDLMLEVEETARSVLDDDSPFEISMHGLDHWVTGDLGLIRIMLHNLIRNAVKFRRKDVPLVIRMETLVDRGQWSISVKDNGIGIDEKHFGKIFGIFQRLHSRDAYEGTGIGLALCHRICGAHGGHVFVESDGENEGAKFTVRLPMVKL